MSVAPATPSSILVSVSGVLQDPTTYAVVGTSLNFSAAPPAGTGNISVRYLGIPASGVTTTAYRTITEFTATAGQTTFTPPSYTVGFINVYRNGVRLGAADYNATNGTTVVLATSATLGDLVTVESFYVSSILNAIPGTAGSVGTTYLADASVNQAKISTNVAGTGPAFGVYRSGTTQTATANIWVKIQFNTEEFDTANAFDNSTNYRFQPLVPGYYQINLAVYQSTSVAANFYCSIFKNGTSFKYGNVTPSNAGTGSCISVASALIYLNGSTDYVEGYCVASQNVTINLGQDLTYFNGSLVRAA
jgi:hypothetical protein